MDSARKLITMPPELAEAVNDYRFRERIGTEAEAIRRLLRAGLDAEKRRPTSPSSAS